MANLLSSVKSSICGAISARQNFSLDTLLPVFGLTMFKSVRQILTVRKQVITFSICLIHLLPRNAIVYIKRPRHNVYSFVFIYLFSARQTLNKNSFLLRSGTGTGTSKFTCAISISSYITSSFSKDPHVV